ncbi:hypothetical protein RN001_010398 [Aquatica leii]|uniref:Uncharacterized protein n=1 Tax=Aquatica leii TaxID=1421715 RepID=A0AAN7SEE9_9COLE|nr:hypothetical protein RN001_010398 [Aquatica leii]
MSPAIVLLLAVSAVAHPTMYKLNENSKFEPDLVPVSSTVIPLPIYQVGYGIKVAPGLNGRKSVIERPEGPITLITAHSKKKALGNEKEKAKN